MSKGLKQMVSEALAEVIDGPSVTVSDEAHRALSRYVRQWSGWNNARLVLGKTNPKVSPYATVSYPERLITADPDRLVLNPNRVLLTVTPFRLRQEAVLTGALLHEVGHVRHSKWMPRSAQEAADFTHSDGTVPSKASVALAKLMEEPRIEGLVAAEANNIGANGLGWTLRASGIALLPMTDLSTDPNRQVMEVITSWALRAGRQWSLWKHLTGYSIPAWVSPFNNLLHDVLTTHFAGIEDSNPSDAARVMDLLTDMAVADADLADEGPWMIDTARKILALLFPETDPEDQPETGGPCAVSDEEPESEENDSEESGDSGEKSPSESGDNGEGDEEGADGEGNTEPEDEGSGDDPGAGDSGDDEDGDEDTDGEPTSADESDDQDADGGEDQSEADSPGDGDSEGEADALAQALADMEAVSDTDTEAAAEQAASEAPPLDALDAGGAGTGEGSGRGEFRTPTAAERDVAKNAEKFLRDLISPSESSHVVLTESPSATVDGAALAAWRAGGQTRDPRFFRRTKRTVEPSPPVKIAVLVDVSYSMSVLQKPSALLSWALASAAIDLRNYAGRGQQVESTLIHWGSDDPRVIQKNGQMLPGLREFACDEGTDRMHDAHDLVEEEIPGFFDMPEKPENRLLVHFTDWELRGDCTRAVTPQIARALENGVNLLTVVPNKFSVDRRYNHRGGNTFEDIINAAKVRRGKIAVLKYNPAFPDAVWDEAAQMIG